MELSKQPVAAQCGSDRSLSHVDLTLIRLLQRLTPQQRLRWNEAQCRALKRLRAASQPRVRIKLMTLQNPPWMKRLPDPASVDLAMIRADPRLPIRERIRRAQLYPQQKLRPLAATDAGSTQ